MESQETTQENPKERKKSYAEFYGINPSDPFGFEDYKLNTDLGFPDMW